MGALKNPKHENFSQAFIEHNGSPKKTMDASGFKWNSSYFSQLKNKPTIQARITELQKSVISDKVLCLTKRMELLTEFALDASLSQNTRIKALQELHKQSGDDIQRVDMDVNAKTESVIRFIDIALPKVTKSTESVEIPDDALESLDKFLGNHEEDSTDNR